MHLVLCTKSENKYINKNGFVNLLKYFSYILFLNDNTPKSVPLPNPSVLTTTHESSPNT